MLANALARSGDLTRARRAADDTTARIGANTPPVFTIAEGFAGAADAYLELWRRSGDRALADPAGVAIGNLARLARVFPIAAPAASTLAGIRLVRLGARRRGTRAIERGRRLADRLGLPYDVGTAREALEIARHS